MKRFCIALITGIFASLASGAQVYVAPDGDDINPGTVDAPKATLNAAIRQVREQRRLKQERASRILLKGGNYYLTEPVFVRPEDSGTPAAPLVIAAIPGTTPVLSGGIEIKGWRKARRR